MMTRDEFEVWAGDPWSVRGIDLESVDCIYKEAYKPLMLECKTIPEMMQLAREFKFFTWGDTQSCLSKCSNYYVEPLHEIFRRDVEPKEYELNLVSPIVLPIMFIKILPAFKKFEIPMLYIGMQYVRGLIELNRLDELFWKEA